jgi:hypothetical protein
MTYEHKKALAGLIIAGLMFLAIAIEEIFFPANPPQEPVPQEPEIRIITAEPDYADLCVDGQVFLIYRTGLGSVIGKVLDDKRQPITCEMEE